MKIVQINAVCGNGSTGKICVSISKMLTDFGIENYIFYTLDKSTYPLGVKYSFKLYTLFQAFKSRVLGNWGFNSFIATLILVHKIKKIKPNIVHIHNIHAHNCNLTYLFKFIKRENIKVIWTFHDCWAFTASCTHFTLAKCNRWLDGCFDCPQIKKTSWFFDTTKKMFEKKRNLYSNVDITVVTPSKWLESLVRKSMFCNCDIRVINNGIDLQTFRPRKSDFRKKYEINKDDFVILGVAYYWDFSKGIDVFYKLANNLGNGFKIVLVGSGANKYDKCPQNMILINQTENQEQLAEIYTAVDLFVNTTREENYPTVHMESLACGTPILSFNTGGCSEALDDSCGCVIPTDDYRALEEKIIFTRCNRPFLSSDCVKKASCFDENIAYKQYIELYKYGTERD